MKRREPWEEGDWLGLLDHLPEPDRLAVRDAARVFVAEVWTWPAEGAARGVWIVRRSGGLAEILVAAGELPDEVLAAALPALGADAVSWDEAVGPGWGARLPGATPVVHEAMVNKLDVVEGGLPPEAEDPAIVPWAAAHEAAVRDLVVRTHAGTPAGLTLAAPGAPTAEGLGQALAAIPLLPGASFVFLAEGRPAGAVLIGLEDGEPTLYDLVVAPEARGAGAGRRLLQAAQRALLARGETRMRYRTTRANAPVHRLYRPDESALLWRREAAFWVRPGAV